MKKIFFALAILASAFMTIQTGFVKKASAIDKSMACTFTYYANGDSKITCSGTGTDCAKVKDCSACFEC